ncbi:carbon-nitrogen hydrolase family protein [Luteimicrobium subarcticum]|uniref:Putative amidohydrolase n=1 Tax=Luteimicrobium subarcticum TaxID=620910 RepID=A0A2M8WTA0_9MICO|nr:carbon-nitrogen hydrolase family protein [Luteimicrobium subarcticum]PJI94175.1 putative amidohydrolase [Luteimicrobium subarcticum]
MRLTVAQLGAGTDRSANLEASRDAVSRAGRVGADLVVLPEYASAFDPHGVGAAHAEPLSGPYVTGLRDVARRRGVGVVAGTLTPGTAGRAVNTVVAIDSTGELVGAYDKVHLYDAFGHRESDRLDAGPADAAPLVWDVAGLRVGVMTCYDLRFPESARRLVDAGAEVLVVPAAWAAGPLKLDHWRTLARARAIENTVVVAAVGQCGHGVTGHSLLVGPDGVVALECGDEPELRTVDLDPAELAEVRVSNPSLANRRYAVVPRG